MFPDFDIASFLNAGLSQPLLQEYFNNPNTFVILRLSRPRPADLSLLPHASLVMTFASYATMTQAFSAGQIPSDIRYILYDNEDWSATPVNEQHAPFTFAAQVANLAHQHGLGLIFAPAADIAKGFDPQYAGTAKFAGYLNLDFAGNGSKVSDIFEIQGQQDEASPGFLTFVSSAVGQARSANPRAVLLLGIATKAPRSSVTGSDLVNVYQETRSLVSGYWINIPGGGPSGQEDPQVAVQFLTQLAPTLGYH